MNINSANGYKGTAFGDPLKPVTAKLQQTGNLNIAANQINIRNNPPAGPSQAAFYTKAEPAPVVNHIYNAQGRIVSGQTLNQAQIKFGAPALENQMTARTDAGSATMAFRSIVDIRKFENRSELLWSASDAAERLQISKQYPIDWTLTDYNYGQLGIAATKDTDAEQSEAPAKNQILAQTAAACWTQASQTQNNILNLLG